MSGMELILYNQVAVVAHGIDTSTRVSRITHKSRRGTDQKASVHCDDLVARSHLCWSCVSSRDALCTTDLLRFPQQVSTDPLNR